MLLLMADNYTMEVLLTPKITAISYHSFELCDGFAGNYCSVYTPTLFNQLEATKQQCMFENPLSNMRNGSWPRFGLPCLFCIVSIFPWDGRFHVRR